MAPASVSSPVIPAQPRCSSYLLSPYQIRSAFADLTQESTMRVLAIRCAVLGFLFSSLCVAAEPDDDELRNAWSQVYLEAAKEVELESPRGEQPLTLQERPLLRWHNPLRRGETHGDFFVWHRDGQPIVVGTLFSYVNPVGGNIRVAAIGLYPLVHEDFQFRFRSFTGIIQGSNLDQLEIAVEAGTSAVKNPATQLTQLRALARSCEAWTVNQGVEQPLRLLSQPLLLRGGGATPSATEDDDSADPASADTTVALFAMVTGTDPELLILMRPGKPNASGSPTWQVTPARFSDLPIKLSIKGNPVWQWQVASNPEPYFRMHRIFQKPLDPR